MFITLLRPSKPSNNYDLFPAVIQQRWQLVSINNDLAPFGLALSDHSLFLYFTTERVGQDRYQYGGKAVHSFRGEYSFDEKGFIETLMMNGAEETYSGKKGGLERLFERALLNAETLVIAGNTLKLYSPKDVLEFALPLSKFYR